MKLELARLADMLEARLDGADGVCTSVSIDTRTLKPGALFVALCGQRYDGHHFIDRAEAAGAAGVVVQRPVGSSLPTIRVPDTRQALGRIGAWWRRQFDLPVAAVTGSNGKTTVKEMLSAICRVAGSTLATRGNLNNDIGVPLTLFELTAEHRYAVIEMGANHAGEIAWLAEVAAPGVGVVTNAAAAHLEGFGTLEGAARGEGGELLAALGRDGLAVINADDRFAPLWRDMAGESRIMEFAVDAKTEYRAALEGDEVVIETPDGTVRTRLALPGRHNLANAAAATAAAIGLGLDLETVGEGLARVRPVPGRLTLTETPAGHRVIDDAYNANPGSLRAALEFLRDLPGEHWLALAVMGELGQDSRALHAQAGEQALEMGVDRLFTVGEETRAAAEAFGHGAVHFDDQAALIRALEHNLHPDVVCLVKGSRRAEMERVVQALMAIGENEHDNNGAEAGAGRGA